MAYADGERANTVVTCKVRINRLSATALTAQAPNISDALGRETAYIPGGTCLFPPPLMALARAWSRAAAACVTLRLIYKTDLLLCRGLMNRSWLSTYFETQTMVNVSTMSTYIDRFQLKRLTTQGRLELRRGLAARLSHVLQELENRLEAYVKGDTYWFDQRAWAEALQLREQVPQSHGAMRAYSMMLWTGIPAPLNKQRFAAARKSSRQQEWSCACRAARQRRQADRLDLADSVCCGSAPQKTFEVASVSTSSELNDRDRACCGCPQ